MGCTASKKRTTSVDDLPKATKDASAVSPASNKNKNGQVTANDVAKSTPPIKRETAKTTSAAPPSSQSQSDTSAIQIPGAHKSFLAPDGIPFIDEDVDDDDEETTTGGGSGDATKIGNAVVRPDENKNVVVKGPSSEPPPAASSKQNVVVVDVQKPPTVVVADERRPVAVSDEQQQQQQREEQLEEEKKRAVALDILTQELDFASEKQSTAPLTFASHETTTTRTVSDGNVTETTVTHELHDDTHDVDSRHISEEDQLKAAIKIQAGIRGYRDRQKVKAIRAAKEHDPASDEPDREHHEDHQETDEHHTAEEHDAAVKIQARFKGFKARQQVKSMKEQSSPHGAESSHDDAQHVSVECSDHDGVQSDEEDPEKQRAATRIQASYKGWKTRKQMAKVK